MSTSSAWPSSVRPIDPTAAIVATELGDIELAVPRTRTFSALRVVRA